MSVGANVWRQIVSGVDAIPWRAATRPMPAVTNTLRNDPLVSLVRQLFFSAGVRRKSVLIATADECSGASGLCEKVAATVAKISDETVAVVAASSRVNGSEITAAEMPLPVVGGAWQAYAIPVADGVWRLAADIIHDCVRNAAPNGGSVGRNNVRDAFDYFVLSASVTDEDAPAFCNFSDAAILVLTANSTRREAALRAKEQLLRYRVNLIGTVLDQRTLPIPGPIYRRL